MLTVTETKVLFKGMNFVSYSPPTHGIHKLRCELEKRTLTRTVASLFQ
jgi:hypothetical protein